MSMNILTFDIEEWYIEKQNNNRDERYKVFENCLDAFMIKVKIIFNLKIFSLSKIIFNSSDDSILKQILFLQDLKLIEE